MKSDYPHHVIFKHRAMRRRDSENSTVKSYTLLSNLYDVTVLALLSRRHFGAWRDVQLSRGEEN